MILTPGLDPIILSVLQGVPNELFAEWDPSDITTLYQDPEMTTPVVAAGDFTGAMLDKGPHGFHLFATGTKRPVYRTSGFKSAVANLQLDGIDDNMRTSSATTFVVPQPLTIFSAHQMSAAISRVVYSGTEIGGVCSLLQIAPNWRLTAGTALAGIANDGNPHVHMAKFDFAESVHAVDGVYGAPGNANSGPLVGFSLGADNSGASPMNGRFAGAKIYRYTLADFEAEEFVRLLAKYQLP
ncbi:MAG: hypothetical protein ACO1SV_12205 [Fimbriimonas sp.]